MFSIKSRSPLARLGILAALTATLAVGSTQLAWAQEHAAPSHSEAPAATEHAVPAEHGAEGHGKPAVHGEGHEAGGHGGGHEAPASRPVFEAEHGTWFNLPARTLFATPEEKAHMAASEKEYAELKERAGKGEKLTAAEEAHLKAGVHYVAKYDWYLYVPLIAILIAVGFTGAAKKVTVRPQGKPGSGANMLEAAVDGFYGYLVGVMGEDLTKKYAPLVMSFFFTILVFNWVGIIPGMLAPTAQPAIPIALGLIAFVVVHIIAIKEAGLKSYLAHYVGEPKWLFFLNVPLHLVGELIKPLSLSLRLTCNVFGEEAVVATLVALAVSLLPAWLPIPFQLPMLFLGTFFGFLQALVFSTLLSIYLSIFATHHDDHDEHNNHGHVDHHKVDGHAVIVAHPSEVTLA